MNKEKSYIIPRRLVKKNMIFEGIGIKEIGVVAAGLAVGMSLFGVLSIFGAGVVVKILLLLIPVGISIGLVVPLSYGENITVLLKRRKLFKKKQQTFIYVRGTR